jgi:Uma2 family endonuclease
MEGPADLVVEIISPESRARDRGEKFYEYEQGGVREYWMLDRQRKQAEFYALGADGIYRLIPSGDDGVFRSVVLPGFWLRVEWLWQDPLPPLMTVLKAWGLV